MRTSVHLVRQTNAGVTTYQLVGLRLMTMVEVMENLEDEIEEHS